MKKLIYLDPGCSGFQIRELDDNTDIEAYLSEECDGVECIYYLVLDGAFTIKHGTADFT